MGDLVLSKNEELGITEYKKVTELHRNSIYETCIIKTRNSIIEATIGHLFMIKDKWWTAAIDIKENDYIELLNGTLEKIISVRHEKSEYQVKIYNLTVEDNHNYYVGNEGLLTHNTIKLKKNYNTKGAADSITKSEYSSLRKKTPNNDIRKMINPEGIKIDPVYGYVTDVLEADHIVPMKEIVDMPGFSQLSREQQIEVLNLKDNFIGLGKPTNASKGDKNWSDWQGHSKLGEIPSDVRSRMLELDATAREALMKAIEERLKK